MNKRFKPLRDKIIVKVFTGEEVSKGGIVITTDKNSESLARSEGEIVALGKSVFYDTESEDVNIGDRVAFSKYAGVTLGKNTDGYEYRTMRDIDIHCVIEEDIK